jgi:hypothetical protein
MFNRNLSKSKLVSFRQCPKRLWLEIHSPELAIVSERSEAIFRTGHQVGELARRLYDVAETGYLIDLKAEGVAPSIARTADLLKERKPIFEAGFAAKGAMAFCDVMLPVEDSQSAWRLVEVKASGSVKSYQRDDAAIQSYVARRAGVDLVSFAVAHIDSKWTYPGEGDYQGLLKEEDLTLEALGREHEVAEWITAAHQVAAGVNPPNIEPGGQCTDPFECGFSAHCNEGRKKAEFPVEWLPRIQSKALKTHIAENGVSEIGQVPESLLNEVQKRVQACTVSGQTFFDAEGAKADLQPHPLPAFFLDFETIAFAVPIWAGTRPFQQIPFQFSLHRVEADGVIQHWSFLDTTGQDPSRSFAEALLPLSGTNEPIFVYNAGFESTRLAELADRFANHGEAIQSVRRRLVDLWPIAARRYYHPSQQGSWSIKKLLPAVVPSLKYDDLAGVSDGGMAQEAFLEAIDPATPETRRQELRKQLLAYCALDTMAMVRIWKVFAGSELNV